MCADGLHAGGHVEGCTAASATLGSPGSPSGSRTLPSLRINTTTGTMTQSALAKLRPGLKFRASDCATFVASALWGFAGSHFVERFTTTGEVCVGVYCHCSCLMLELCSRAHSI